MHHRKVGTQRYFHNYRPVTVVAVNQDLGYVPVKSHLLVRSGQIIGNEIPIFVAEVILPFESIIICGTFVELPYVPSLTPEFPNVNNPVLFNDASPLNVLA